MNPSSSVESKTQKKGKVKRISGGPVDRIEQHRHGLIFRRGVAVFIPDPTNRPKRGKVKGWSAASRRRLRQLLVSTDLAVPSLMFGVTLTCPWCVDDWKSVGSEWRKAMKAFSESFKRRFKDGAMVYRTELQQRGAPHLHGVVYLPASLDWLPFKAMAGIPLGVAFYLQTEIYKMWSRAMSRLPWTKEAAKGAFHKHGVLVDALSEKRASAMRYVCDHASKKKQAQLGWEGRQWGVIGGKRLVKDKPISLDGSDRVAMVYARLVRRLVRYRVKDGRGVFGSHLSKKRANVGTVFATEDAQNRLLTFAADLVLSPRPRLEEVEDF